jgi:hypothetical protein
MTINYLKIVPVTVFPLGNFRSLPAEVGTAAPLDPVRAPRHLEYPQEMSIAAPDLVIPPREPTNDSLLAFPIVSTHTDEGKPMSGPSSESQMHKLIHGVSTPPSLAEEIERALEIMRRMRTARAAQDKGDPQETPGNKYELPEAPVLRVSSSTERD